MFVRGEGWTTGEISRLCGIASDGFIVGGYAIQALHFI